MFTQNMLRELAIRKAIECINEDPTAGYMWERQFLELLGLEPAEDLQIYTDNLKRISQKLDTFVYMNDNWDFDFEKAEF